MKSLLVVLLAPALCCAAETPQDFAFGMPLEIDGREALYEVEIPASVYQGVARRDLGDLRVFNADGEPVPFALEPRPPQQKEKPPPVAVKVFPALWRAGRPIWTACSSEWRKAVGGTVVSVRSEGANPPRNGGCSPTWST